MVGLFVDNLLIKSNSGDYDVFFNPEIAFNELGTHYIIDKNVYPTVKDSIKNTNIVLIDANEDTKKLENIGTVIEELTLQNFKKDSKLVAIGGGITQDIACFIAATYMRGIKWVFVPTTLLAQADSCIGSKSSINFKNYKNLLGTFTPPNEIYISQKFLFTLNERDVKSGLGEILKLHLIAKKSFDLDLISLKNISEYIFESLKIKQKYIEEDEFDKGIRNILNYGHCIGHAIESATNFEIPHGIAISMGMDIVNRFSCDRGLISEDVYQKMHQMILPLYEDFLQVQIDINDVFLAQKKDKKNTNSNINLILPVGEEIEKMSFPDENEFWIELKTSFNKVLNKVSAGEILWTVGV